MFGYKDLLICFREDVRNQRSFWRSTGSEAVAPSMARKPGTSQLMTAPWAGQVQPDLADAVLVGVVGQQVPGELADLADTELAGHDRGLAVQQQPADHEIRVRAADVPSAREFRTDGHRGRRQRAEPGERLGREFQLPTDILRHVLGTGRDQFVQGRVRVADASKLYRRTSAVRYTSS